jgi:DNA modification methylase
LKIQRRKIDKLKNDPANARKHSPRNLKAIRDSLDVFGQQKPIVIDSRGVVIAGNGTLEAARELGWDEIDVAVTDLDPAHAQAFGIADNRTAELAEWDTDVLGELLEGMDRDLVDILSIDDIELPDSLDGGEHGEGLTDPDEIPEPPIDPITQTGDLWFLGDHRLLCGDATRAEDAERVMDGTQADLWITDPPYNVDYEGTTGLKIQNDSMPDEQFRKFLFDAFLLAFNSCKLGAPFYVWHADSEGFNFRGAIRDCGEKVRQCLIWVKSSLVLGRQDYQWQHEPCLYGWKNGAAHYFSETRTETTVIDDVKPVDLRKMKREELIEFATDLMQKESQVSTTVLREAKPSANFDHPTMKPVKLIANIMRNSSIQRGVIYDPFLGSGTTIIAAEQLGRKCYGMEIDPKYCDVIVKRWEDFTGQTATRENELQ